MTKRYDDSIDVTTDPVEANAPLAFSWRGRRYVVDQQLASWREDGEWWDSDRRRAREYFRLLARPVGALATGDLDADGFMRSSCAVFDVYRDRLGGAWHLARVWD